MSKKFRALKEFRKSHGWRGKLTFSNYKKVLHWRQKRIKQEKKNLLKAKSMLRQGRKYVVVGDTVYFYEKDKESFVALIPDFDGIRRAIKLLKKERGKCFL